MVLLAVLLLFASLSDARAAVFEPERAWKRQSSSQITTVDLSTNLGTPLHLASGTRKNYCMASAANAKLNLPGFIYGIPDTPNQIPDHFYTGSFFSVPIYFQSFTQTRNGIQLCEGWGSSGAFSRTRMDFWAVPCKFNAASVGMNTIL